ncbi:MAG: DeoR/GlpR family DNA-binding transcription regulator [Actinomycetaceae bacterium]|nr:DeoR/GlpR family DNA-binding transcription regulator [Actinomycetaceae bacterium]
MDRHQRLSALVELIVDRGAIRVDDAVRELGVSAATVRRDLDALADQQLITRTRGGARANAATGDVPMRYRAVVKPAEKTAIARTCAQLVAPGEVVGCNGGTTTTLAAYELGVRVSAEDVFEDNGITVVTNAVNIANDLVVRPRVRVVVTGGVVRSRSYELIGPLSDLILPSISIDTLFLGVNGVEADKGIFANHEGEAAVNAALVRAAQKVVVVADSSKIGVSAFARITTIDKVDALVTDTGADAQVLAKLRRQGVEVHLAQTSAVPEASAQS